MDLIKLNTRLFLSPINNEKDNTIVYCFAHHISNIKNIVVGLEKYNIKSIYILKNVKEMSGVADYESIVKKYKEYNIETTLIPFHGSKINTKNESDTVIEYALSNNIKNIIVCAPMFHTLRAAMTIISSAMEKDANINISPIIYQIDNWDILSITHQGESNYKYHILLEMELDRIYKYIEKGDIRPSKDIWNYLDTF